MYRPLTLFVGLRFVRARKKNHLLSFVSVISMLGIALGVLALIAVLSVINASTSTMRDETLKAVPHASIVWPDTGPQWQEGMSLLEQSPDVLAVAPFIEGEAWLRFDGQGQFAAVRGVSALDEPDVQPEPNPHLNSLLERLAIQTDGIILGSRLASRLGVFNDEQLAVTPLSDLLAGQLNGARSFQVLGIADFGFYDSGSTALVNLDAARELYGQKQSPLQLRLKVDDVFRAEAISREAVAALPAADYRLSSWEQSRRNLFDALKLEKIMTGFMLLMIVIIGAVNIVATLVMTVADKQADIAILRTMGASRRAIMSVFMVQGLAAGIMGTILGVAGGIALSNYLGDLTRWFEGWLNNLLAPGEVYMIAHLNAELRWSDVSVIALCSVLISLLATLYPAWRASRVQPADVLRYE